MGSRTDKPDASLFDHLDGINERLQELADADFVRDPDALAARLDFDVAVLTGSLESIMADVQPVPSRPVDLNRVVDHACRELLFAIDPPLAITTSLDPLLPPLPHTYGGLFAVVLRGLQLFAERAGPSGELFVTTTTDGYHDVVAIRSKSAVARTVAEAGFERRVVALSDLLDGLGGTVAVHATADGEIAEMSLTFETRASRV